MSREEFSGISGVIRGGTSGCPSGERWDIEDVDNVLYMSHGNNHIDMLLSEF